VLPQGSAAEADAVEREFMAGPAGLRDHVAGAPDLQPYRPEAASAPDHELGERLRSRVRLDVALM
jgi:hypothetical protein